MKHIQTLQKSCLRESLKYGGCGECQASCQSACKTSCTVANQSCQNKKEKYGSGISRDGIRHGSGAASFGPRRRGRSHQRRKPT